MCLHEQTNRNMGQEIMGFRRESEKQRRIIQQLERERDRYINENGDLTMKVMKVCTISGGEGRGTADGRRRDGERKANWFQGSMFFLFSSLVWFCFCLCVFAFVCLSLSLVAWLCVRLYVCLSLSCPFLALFITVSTSLSLSLSLSLSQNAFLFFLFLFHCVCCFLVR